MKTPECVWSEAGHIDSKKYSHAQYFQFNDGGREETGFKGQTNDCVTRSIAIVTGKPYREIYDILNELSKSERTGKHKKNKSNSRLGVYKNTYKKYLISLGLTWTPTMFVGQGCKIHLRGDELPKGKLIISLSRHITTMIDGVIYDICDCSRTGTRCVYGYFT